MAVRERRGKTGNLAWYWLYMHSVVCRTPQSLNVTRDGIHIHLLTPSSISHYSQCHTISFSRCYFQSSFQAYSSLSPLCFPTPFIIVNIVSHCEVIDFKVRVANCQSVQLRQQSRIQSANATQQVGVASTFQQYIFIPPAQSEIDAIFLSGQDHSVADILNGIILPLWGI